VWAIAVVAKRLVAVVAKCAESFWIVVLFEPTINVAAATQLFPVLIPDTVNVVNAEKFISGLATAGTRLAVILKRCNSQPLAPFTGVGRAVFRVKFEEPFLVCRAMLSPLGVVLVPVVIIAGIFPVPLRVLSSVLTLPFDGLEGRIRIVLIPAVVLSRVFSVPLAVLFSMLTLPFGVVEHGVNQDAGLGRRFAI
jgi:hypothetical protein